MMTKLAAILLLEKYEKYSRNYIFNSMLFKIAKFIAPCIPSRLANFRVDPVKDGGSRGRYVSVPPFFSFLHFLSYGFLFFFDSNDDHTINRHFA